MVAAGDIIRASDFEDSGWINTSISFSANFTDSATKYRTLLGGTVCELRINGSYAGANLTPSVGTGNITDTTLLTLPASVSPSSNNVVFIGGAGGAKYMAYFQLGTNGVLKMTKVNGDGTNIVAGDAIDGSVFYILG